MIRGEAARYKEALFVALSLEEEGGTKLMSMLNWRDRSEGERKRQCGRTDRYLNEAAI